MSPVESEAQVLACHHHEKLGAAGAKCRAEKLGADAEGPVEAGEPLRDTGGQEMLSGQGIVKEKSACNKMKLTYDFSLECSCYSSNRLKG